MAKRSRIAALVLLLFLCASLIPAPVRAEDPAVTIGFLPLATRAELVLAVMRAVPLAKRPVRAGSLPFADRAVILVWGRSAAAQAVALGLIGDFWGNSFRAGETATRREAAAVIRRLIDLLRE